MKHQRIKRITWISLGCIAAAYVISIVAVLIDGLTDQLARADAAIVLGNTVHPDGTPSSRLAARLDRTLELFRDGYVSFIIVSGGLGREGHNEAVVMRDYMLAHGMPPDRIYVDPAGLTTYLTARDAAQIMRAHNLESATVVSQYFHISRARLALQRCGVERVYSAHAAYVEWRDVYSLVREIPALYSYALRKCPE